MSPYALLDCNNFYASCERLFRPDLEGRPVVVLSNNDGCVIARSEEAKGLGIAMGTPFFKCASFLRRHGTAVFSSNYALYGDLSRRVMEVVQQSEPRVEIYSIDEAFVRLPAAPSEQLVATAARLRAEIRRQVGLPVSIGIGATKTLAKVANRQAKKNRQFDGVFDLGSLADPDQLLAQLPAEAVWGIGRRHAARLTAANIHSALDLKNANDAWLRRHLTVTGLRTAMELRGISCLPLEEAPPPRQSITCSRSFGKPVESLVDLREALTTYTSVAAEKLRRQQRLAASLHIFLFTNRHKPEEPQYAASRTFTLPAPTDHSGLLIRQALQGLEALYRPGFRYQKAGVILIGLTSRKLRQPGLFDGGRTDATLLMAALDHINDRWGRDTLHYGSAGFEREWKNRQQLKSPSYTTSWQELPVVRA